MQDVALDACCLINLSAGKILVRAPPSASARSGSRHGGAARAKPASGLGLNVHVPSMVIEETLYILQPDEEDASKLVKVPIDLGHRSSAGLLHKCEFESPEEIELFVQMATRLGDGEAACFAVAARRGWTLATDDRRSRRFAGESGLAVVSTPELVKLWAENTRADDAEIAAVLQNIERFACFVPRSTVPEYGVVGELPGQSRNLTLTSVAVYDVQAHRDQGPVLEYLAKQYPAGLIRVGIQPDERICGVYSLVSRPISMR